MQPRRQAIPIILLLKTAFQILWQQRDDALRLGLVPTLMTFGGFIYAGSALDAFLTAMESGGMQGPTPEDAPRVMVLSGIVIVAICLTTTNWLRFLLLGPMGAVGIGLNIGRPHFRFLASTIVLGIVMMTALMVCAVVLSMLPHAVALVGNFVAFAAIMLALTRFVPFLVGQAIGQQMTLAQSWNVSRGNAMGIALSLVLMQLPFIIGLTVLQQILNLIGFSTLAPAGTLFIVSVVQVAGWICQAGILAAAYRHMVGVRV